jgi:hypothetical protein
MTSDKYEKENDPMVMIGMRAVWDGTQPFGIGASDRRQHMHIVGKTGTGKTTLVRNLILQDIYLGHGVGVIDPHGDLARDVLDHIPSNRTEDVVYFDPADQLHPIGFNLFHNVHPDRRHRVVSGIIGALKSIWHDSWGPRLEYILSAAIAALLDCENVTMLGIQRMLVDPLYRRWVVKQVKDPVVRSFWRDEFEHYDPRFRQEAIAPIQNKVGQLLMAPPMRNVLGQIRRKIDPKFIMDNRRIFIANLSKGSIGEDKSSLLGAILTTSFELAAMERVAMSEHKRRDFYLYVDEFQNITTESFASILSEARKYRLCLTLSHQYTDQIRESVRKAIFGNVGTMISFRVGENDARILSREFGDTFVPAQFTSLGNFEVLAKTLQSGEQLTPFRAKTLPRLAFNGGRSEIIRRRSREKYAVNKHIVERKIGQWISERRSPHPLRRVKRNGKNW